MSVLPENGKAEDVSDPGDNQHLSGWLHLAKLIRNPFVVLITERQMKMTVHPHKATRQVVLQKIMFRLAVLAALAFSAWILHFFLRPFLIWLALLVQ